MSAACDCRCDRRPRCGPLALALVHLGLVSCLLVLFGALPADAQNRTDGTIRVGQDVELVIGGTGQVRASYGLDDGGAERLGVGVRRARLRFSAQVGERVRAFAQLEGAREALYMTDLRLAYALSPTLSVRAGRFVTPQPAAFARTVHSQLDAVERSVVAREWASRTVGADGRDFAVELLYDTETLTVELALGNGDGNWARVRGNAREDLGLGDVTSGSDRLGGAVKAAAVWRPPMLAGVEAGAYAGFNTARNPNTALDGAGRTYGSYAAHVYWGRLPGSQPVRLKADVIGIRYEARPGVPGQHLLGGVLFGALGLGPGAEVFARGERLVPDLNGPSDAATFLTIGGSVSPSAMRGGPYGAVRFTLDATTRLGPVPDGAGRLGVVLQGQVVF